MLDDQTLQATVIEELEWDPSFDAAHIGVAAKHGVVTLSGFVDSYAAKAAAERATRRVRGVKAIAEEIEVRLPSAQKHADDEIAERAVRILAWDIQVPDEHIQVKVEHGLVTLTGEVAYRFEKTAAEADVRQLGGVRGVLNLVRVSPLAIPAADPEIVEQKITAALRRNAEIEASHIEVSSEHGRVTLRGQVRTWLERTSAENAAWASPGVIEVDNELRVSP
jgi:osmotically-inducible protein OsmY